MNDGVYRSDEGWIQLLHPLDDTLGLINVGHVYLWKTQPKSVRHSWKLQKRDSGYVFYNDYNEGAWMRCDSDDFLVTTSLSEQATVWNIKPDPVGALLRNTSADTEKHGALN